MASNTLAFSPITSNPSQAAGLFPGANMGGGSAGFGTPAPVTGLGGATSPFTPQIANGTSTTAAGTVSPYGTNAGTTALSGLTGAGGSAGGINQASLTSGLTAAGYPGQDASSLAQFVSQGSGYSPQVAQALIAALQPQFAQGQANLSEQFGAMGLAGSSANAIAQGQYEAQTNLAVGQLLSGLYEQSVQNYLSILQPTSSETTSRISANASMLSSELSPLNSLLGNLGFGGSSGTTI